jgi:hypothetical protein
MADECPMPFQHGFGLDEQNGFAQTLLPPLGLGLQTGGEGDEHPFFGTRKTWLRVGFALKHAELLTQEGNLRVFLVVRKPDRRQHTNDERGEAQQEVINHP